MVFLLQEWKKVQALVGKTGKEGLKRRCLEYDPQTLANKMEIAVKAKEKMAAFELDDVRDVSAGAATFYLWVSSTRTSIYSFCCYSFITTVVLKTDLPVIKTWLSKPCFATITCECGMETVLK